MRSHSLTCVAALIFGGYSLGALAQPIEYYATVVADPEVRSKVVRYGDLNLQRHEGVTALYRRIENAANFVCTGPNERTPEVAVRIHACALDATSRAVAQVGVPALAALHAKRSGTAPAELVARQTR